MDPIKIELVRINNIFTYVLVVSTLVFLYSMSFKIKSVCQGSVNPFNDIVIMSFLCSALSVIFWQYNGYLRDKNGINYLHPEKADENEHQTKLKNFADEQIVLIIVFIVCLAGIIFPTTRQPILVIFFIFLLLIILIIGYRKFKGRNQYSYSHKPF